MTPYFLWRHPPSGTATIEEPPPLPIHTLRPCLFKSFPSISNSFMHVLYYPIPPFYKWPFSIRTLNLTHYTSLHMHKLPYHIFHTCFHCSHKNYLIHQTWFLSISHIPFQSYIHSYIIHNWYVHSEHLFSTYTYESPCVQNRCLPKEISPQFKHPLNNHNVTSSQAFPIYQPLHL